MRIMKDSIQCLAVDYQEKLVPVMQEKERLLERSAMFLKGLRLLGVPVTVTEQYPKGLGKTVPKILTAAGTKTAFDKITFSCLEDEKIKEHIVCQAGRRFVAVCGIEAHICVLQTVVDLCGQGYVPVVAADCIASKRSEDREAALERMKAEGAYLTTSESLLYELMRSAKNEAFRDITALVKEQRRID
jgi:hypothetical protein